MEDPDPHIVCKTVNYLAGIEDVRVRDRLIKFLAIADQGSGYESIWIRRAQSYGIAVSSPGDAASDHSYANPWALSALALRWFPDPEVINALINALGYSDPAIREFALLSLGSVGVESVVPNILPLLQDESTMVRRAAVWGLGRLGQELAISYLRNIEKFDPERIVREQARLSLEELEHIQ
jgi:hypothetical protein